MRRKLSDTTRMVLVFGADTQLGTAVVGYLQDKDQSCIPRPTDYYDGKDAVREIHKDIRAKKPSVVINCLLDPDSGFYPLNSNERLIAPSLAMLQQCRVSGMRYILCSSARAYGQQETTSGNGYSEYDPWMSDGYDQWRAIIQSVDASIWQQTSFASLQAKVETHANFEYYCLRLGHLLHTNMTEKPLDANPLSKCLLEAIKGRQAFICGRPGQRISPIDVQSVAAAIHELCAVGPRPVSGTYNIASRNSTTIQALFNHVSMQTGNPACVGAMCRNDASAMEIYGVDADQALDTGFWCDRARTKLPTWQQAVDKIVKQVLPTVKRLLTR